MLLWRALVSVCLLRLVDSGEHGQKAKKECKKYGMYMPECHNVLYPEKRIRVHVDVLMYPHMVLLGYGNSSSPKWNCGGSLISANWVLTAAHCLMDPKLGAVKVLRAGTATFEFDESDDAVQEREVAVRVPHPQYRPPSKYNDIALLQPISPFQLNRDIRIACLQVEHDFNATSAVVIGFGTTKSGSDRGSATLMRVDVDMVDSGKCNKTMKPLIGRGVLREGVVGSQLCAGDWHQGGRDACQGDSGGPLMRYPEDFDCREVFPLYYTVGVTSFGRFCGYKKAPGVYTRVSYFVPWIESVVWS